MSSKSSDRLKMYFQEGNTISLFNAHGRFYRWNFRANTTTGLAAIKGVSPSGLNNESAATSTAIESIDTTVLELDFRPGHGNRCQSQFGGSRHGGEEPLQHAQCELIIV
jgi:hypothetical protein